MLKRTEAVELEDYNCPVVHRRQIRWGETDSAGIVYTVRFIDFAMDSIEYWFSRVLSKAWFALNMREHTGTPFVHIDIDFKAPVTPDHVLSTEVRVSRLGSASIEFTVHGYRQDGVLSFVGNFVCCMVDNRTMKPKKIPLDYRQRIQKYMDQCDAG